MITLPGEEGEEGIFSHSERFEQGLGRIRPGQATMVVALDGSGDAATIQEGIDMLPSTGGVVFVKEGTYKIKSNITIKQNNTSIVGTGRATVIEATVDDLDMIKTDSKDGIIIEKLFLKESGGFGNNTGILCTGSDKVLIKECYIEGLTLGIEATTSATRLIITDNFLDAQGSTQIDIRNSTNAIISGNRITGGGGVGINFPSAAFGEIIGNEIATNQSDGISMSSSNQVVISGNNVHNQNEHGIALGDCNNCVVSNNICRDNDVTNSAGFDGIIIDGDSNNNVISGNRCIDNDNYEINIANAACDKNIVIGNVCIGTDHVGAINDSGTNTHPNGASGTNNLALDDLNIIA